MSSKWIDITMPLSAHMVVWPGFDAPSLKWNRRFEEGHRSITSTLTTNLHNGTHIDAPLHFIPDEATVDQLALDPFIGPAVVVDAIGVDAITADVLQERVPKGATRVLLKTNNSLRQQRVFNEKFVALTLDGALWLTEAGVQLIGNDYPSIAVFKGDAEIHRSLMRANVNILEGIVLEDVEPGEYELVCLPLLIEGAEGSPARAVIRKR